MPYYMSWFPFFRWGNWGSEKFSNVPKVMDLAKALGWVLSVPKPFCCHRARPPWVMSVWLRNEKELMERPFHCSFHYFTLWMTNKQTLPQGICILKEELINPNESLIGGIVGGAGCFWALGLSPVSSRCLAILFSSVDDQLFWNQNHAVECSHNLLVCPKCNWMN